MSFLEFDTLIGVEYFCSVVAEKCFFFILSFFVTH